MKSAQLEDCIQFTQDRPHPKLWQLIGNHAVKKGVFDVALRVYTKSADYFSVTTIKRILKIQNKDLKDAEVARFLGDFHAAEAIYTRIDRPDLTLDMYYTLCDWFKLLELSKQGIVAAGFTTDTILEKLGDYFFERRHW